MCQCRLYRHYEDIFGISTLRQWSRDEAYFSIAESLIGIPYTLEEVVHCLCNTFLVDDSCNTVCGDCRPALSAQNQDHIGLILDQHYNKT